MYFFTNSNVYIPLYLRERNTIYNYIPYTLFAMQWKTTLLTNNPMFKSANFITCFAKDDFMEFISDAITAFQKLEEYDSEKEYTVMFDRECNTFDIYLLN